MDIRTQFDYYYGDESEQFSFFRIPRLLFTDARYKGISTDAKLLYGLMLDRMGLSQRNGWYDAQGRVFIYYPMAEVQEVLDCGHDKAGRIVAELERQYGLIERVKQGQGKPAKIYVKRFTAGNTPPPAQEMANSVPATRRPVCEKSEYHTAKNAHFRSLETEFQEVSKPDGNYTKENYTDLSYINQSINPTGDCRKSEGAQVDKSRLFCQQEEMTDTSCPLEAPGNASQIETHFRQEPTGGDAEAGPEAAAANFSPQSAPARNFDSKIPQVGGKAPKPPFSPETRLKKSPFETHFYGTEDAV